MGKYYLLLLLLNVFVNNAIFLNEFLKIECKIIANNASNESWARKNCHMISLDKRGLKMCIFRSFLKVEKVFAVRQFKGREFQTDGAA